MNFKQTICGLIRKHKNQITHESFMKNGEVNTISCKDCGKLFSTGWLIGTKNLLAEKGFDPSKIQLWSLCEHDMKPGYICSIKPFDEIQTTISDTVELTEHNIEHQLTCSKCGYGVF